MVLEAKSTLVFQVATLIAVYANWGFARIKGIGWGWAGVIWIYSVVFYIPLDFLKFAIRYILSGKAWLNLLENKVYLFSLITFDELELCIQRSQLNLLNIFLCNRLHSPPRRIMVKRREKLNGLLLRGPCMDFNHQKLPVSSMKRAATGSCLRLQNRLRDELRLHGMSHSSLKLSCIQINM